MGCLHLISQILSKFKEIPEGIQQAQLVNLLIQLTSKDKELVQFVGEHEIKFIESKKINHISIGSKVSEYHLVDGSVLTTNAVKSEFFVRFVEKGFIPIDRSIYVNRSNIKWYDLNDFRIYFNDEDYILVAGSAVKRLKQVLGNEKDIKNSPNHCKPTYIWL